MSPYASGQARDATLLSSGSVQAEESEPDNSRDLRSGNSDCQTEFTQLQRELLQCRDELNKCQEALRHSGKELADSQERFERLQLEVQLLKSSSEPQDLNEAPEQHTLADLLSSPDDGHAAILEANLEDVQRIADDQNMRVIVYQFSELDPGQTLQEHVQQQLLSGACPHPSDPMTLKFCSQRLQREIGLKDLDAARRYWGLVWAPDDAVVGTFSGRKVSYTPLHNVQEWQTLLKNIANANYRQYTIRSVVPGAITGRPSEQWNTVTQPILLLGSDGRRHWGMVRQVVFSSPPFRQRWALRDLNSNKLTLFCSTYVDRHTGVILNQNATSMSVFGCHGEYNCETGLMPAVKTRSNGSTAPAPQRAAPNQHNYNFLEMLFEANKEELERLHVTVRSQVYRIDGLEIVNPTLRAWMGLQPGQDAFHDVQVASTYDADTLEQTYAISQIDVTDRVLAKRQLQCVMSRQFDLIACLGKLQDIEQSVSSNAAGTGMLDNIRRQLLEASDNMRLAGALEADASHIRKLELLGQGTFGTVHKAIWNNKLVAVKSMVLPMELSPGKKHETMAIMEAAISSSLNHPNIVQTYTYSMQPIRHPKAESCSMPETSDMGLSPAQASAVTGFEVQLVLELCDRGSLRHALNQQLFVEPSGHLKYAAILETAMDIARGMQHLHKLDIVHSDLKAQNVLLQSNERDHRGFSAKIADFGLSLQIDEIEPDVRRLQGTPAYMAPELFISGKQSAAADVFAYGITLWELYTSGNPLQGLPLCMLAHQVTENHRRPTFPAGAPVGFVALVQRCWDPAPAARPSFTEIISCLTQLMLCKDDEQLILPRLSTEGAGLAPSIDSPAEQMLMLLEQVITGKDVNMDEAIKLYDSILSIRDVRQPVDMEQKLLSMNLDKDVSRSLIMLLTTPEMRNDRRYSLAGLDCIEECTDIECLTPASAYGDPSPRSPTRMHHSSFSGSSESCQLSDSCRLYSNTISAPNELQIPDSNSHSISKSPSDAMLLVLATLDSWDFDAFELNEVTGGRPLSSLVFAMITRFDLNPSKLPIEKPRLANFMRRVEDGYRAVPYHNKVHATDVVHSIYSIMTQGGVLKSAWSRDLDMVLFTAIFTSAIHDYEHVGLNNDYLVRSKDSLALLYNDRSPMENHHASAAFMLLQHDQYNFLQGMSDAAFAVFRKQAIEMVIATDMKQHFSMVSLFNSKFGAAAAAFKASASGTHASRSSMGSFRGSIRGSMGGSALGGPERLSLDDDTLTLVLQLALKCADLGSLALSTPLNIKWARALEEEMFLQGDREREAGLPISPLMDRHCPKGGVTRAQTGFYSFVALPMFQAFSNVFPGVAPMVKIIQNNFARWQTECL